MKIDIINNEDKCYYVSSYGLIKNCNIKSKKLRSSIKKLIEYNFNEIKENDIIHICSSALEDFIKNYLNNIKVRFRLLTSDSDKTISLKLFRNEKEFKNFIENEKLIHWFSQNLNLEHSKISNIPIGLDYHTLNNNNHYWGKQKYPFYQEKELIKIQNESKIFWERKFKCFSNFHFSMENYQYGDDRKDAIKEIPKELIYYQDKKSNRRDTWLNQIKYIFVISPHGNGLDCHRTWESLILGNIVIVKKSSLDKLYEDLPVIIVNNWYDIDEIFLKNKLEELKKKKFNYEKLTLKYWLNYIKNIK